MGLLSAWKQLREALEAFKDVLECLENAFEAGRKFHGVRREVYEGFHVVSLGMMKW